MIKDRFAELPFSQKIQLYLLVPLLYALFWIVLESYLLEQSSEHRTFKSNYEKKREAIIKFTPKKGIGFIEDRLSLYEVELDSLKIEQKLLSIELIGEFQNLLTLLKKLEIHFQIMEFKFIKEEDLTRLYVKINSSHLFNKKLVKKEFQVKSTKEQTSHTINIEAIVDNEVLIGGKWFKKNDICSDNFKLSYIAQRYVKFIDLTTKKEFKVELLNESL